MKQLGCSLSLILLFFFMLSFPKQTLAGASNGLLLWFQILLPTLLPFLVLTNLLLHTNSMIFISNIIGSFFQKFFRVSESGSFAILSGFLCGYPVGAKITADLVRTKRITTSEGQYLLSFCNNTSPAFISGYLIAQHIKDPSLLFSTIFITYFSPIVCSFIFRQIHKENGKNYSPLYAENSTIHFSFEILDTCIMNSFETITKIGGYIILFSVLISLGKLLPALTPILPFLEITNGIPAILNQISDFSLSYIGVMFLTSFGGICAIAQTKSMLYDTRLSIFPYIIEKLITAMVTSLFTLVYVRIILFR